MIKHNNQLISHKIIYNENCGYSMECERPLVFASLPEMVEYYSNPHPDFPYRLINGIPTYDNHLLNNSLSNRLATPVENIASTFRHRLEGPTLPPRRSARLRTKSLNKKNINRNVLTNNTYSVNSDTDI